jgi:polyisoprenoid-binding protein YceI
MALPLPVGRWTLDLTHTTVEFTVRHLGISKVRGRFKTFNGEVEVGEDLASSSIRAEVDLASVDTNNADRDTHLRGTDFFGVDAHPTMAFESTSISDAGAGRYVVEGMLSINGRTNPLALDVEFFGTEVFPGDGSTHAGFSASGSLSRKAFGVEFNVPLGAGGFVISDNVNIELDVQLVAAQVAVS